MDSSDFPSTSTGSATGESPNPHKPKSITMKVALPSRGVRIKTIPGRTVGIPATIAKPSRTSAPKVNHPLEKQKPSSPQLVLPTEDLPEEQKATATALNNPPVSHVENSTTSFQVLSAVVPEKSTTLTIPVGPSTGLAGKLSALIPQITALGLAGKSLILIPQTPLAGKPPSVTQPVQTGSCESSKSLTPQVRSNVCLGDKPTSLIQTVGIGATPKPQTTPVRPPTGVSKPLTSSVRPPAGMSKPLTPSVRPPAGVSKPLPSPVRPPAGMSKPMTPSVRPPSAMSKPLTPPIQSPVGMCKPMTPPVRPPAGMSKPLTAPVRPPFERSKGLIGPVSVPPRPRKPKPLTPVQTPSVPVEKPAGLTTSVPAEESQSQPPPSTVVTVKLDIDASDCDNQNEPISSAQPAPVDPSKFLPPAGYYTQPAKRNPTHCAMCNVKLQSQWAGMHHKLRFRGSTEVTETWVERFFKFKPKYYERESEEYTRLCHKCHRALTNLAITYRKLVGRVNKNSLMELRIPAHGKPEDDEEGLESGGVEVATQTEGGKEERVKAIGSKMKQAEKSIRGRQVISNYFKNKLREEMTDVCKYSSLAKESLDPEYKLPPNGLIFDELTTFAPNVYAALEGLCIKHRFIPSADYKVNSMVTILGVAMGAQNKYCTTFQKSLGYVLWKTGGSHKAFQHCNDIGLSTSRSLMCKDLNKTNRGIIPVPAKEDEDDDDDDGEENLQSVSETGDVKVSRPKAKRTVKQSVFSIAATPRPEKLSRDRRTAYYWMKKKQISVKQLGINEKKRKAEVEAWQSKAKRRRK